MSPDPADRGRETTVDHGEIKTWVEQNDGVPARTTAAGDRPGGLRIAFPSDAEHAEMGPTLDDEGIEEISWSRFFETFEEENLAFRYRESRGDDATGRSYELVDRAGADVNEEEATDELVGEEVMSATATRAANVEPGMDVTTPAEGTVGVVSQVSGARIYVDPDPGLTDRVKIELGWGDAAEDEETYAVPETRIERIDEDEVQIHPPT